jgi:2-C-methyl-D-erythritol 4-phosphate cytidylyltransferase
MGPAEVNGVAPRRAIAAVVLAGGSGLRVGHDRNKAYLPLGDRTAVGMSLSTMAAAPGVRRLVLVVRTDDVDLAERTIDEELPRLPVRVELVVGGSSRHGSEEQALRHLEPAIDAGAIDLVLIHDAARPMCSPELVSTLVRAAAENGGAVPGLVADDLAAAVDDDTLVPLAGTHVRVQTPQVFAAAPLLAAYRRAGADGFEGTDTAACIERYSGLEVVHVTGDERNFKITYPHDLHIANEFVRRHHV